MKSLVLVLRSAGFHAAGETAATALTTAELHRPDILISDVQLGEKNGVELSLDIAKLLPSCRIILMSGDTTSAKILADAHEHGHDFEVLPKPTLPEELLALLGPASSFSTASSNAVGEFTFMERRSKERIHFEAPATVAVEQHCIAASTKDISDRGVFVFTDARFERGSETDVVLMLPEEVGLPVSGIVCCHGRVVRSNSTAKPYCPLKESERFAPVQQV